MCTIMTISRDIWSRQIERQIELDASCNPHGSALLTVDRRGNMSLLKTFNVRDILCVLRNTDWTRFWLHQRYATQGRVALENAHGWAANGWTYMHNGQIRATEATKVDVDSQAIGIWLEQGIDAALMRLNDEAFANVMLIADDGYYVVHRSTIGSLYTDGQGNYSTNAVGPISEQVAIGAAEHEMIDDDEWAERDERAEREMIDDDEWAERDEWDGPWHKKAIK